MSTVIGGSLQKANNLSDVADAIAAAANLGINTTDWVDFSATAAPTGYSSAPTGANAIFLYQVIGKCVMVLVYCSGTSNTNALTFTLPFTSKAIGNNTHAICRIASNGVTAAGMVSIATNSNQASVNASPAGAVFATSGTKTLMGEFFFIKA